MSDKNETQFGNLYSQYYDLLYLDKDYNAEVEFIDNLINTYASSKFNLLDLGCGTGKHCELFCESGYKVHGVDLSADMLSIAKAKCVGREGQLSFTQASICEFDSDEIFDIAVSLFHVMSYQNSNTDLLKTFQVVKKQLKKGGLFIFDFWYGPAVLTDLPKTRIKRLENEQLKVTRIAESVMRARENVVDVTFNLFLENKATKLVEMKTETHHMRYFFDTELEMLCDQVGFDIKYKSAWLSEKSPDFNSWNVVWVIQNK